MKYHHYVNHIEALDRILELTVVLNRDMEQDLARRGLTASRVHLLWVLGQRGEATQRELADALGVSPRNITGLVDALAETGFVVRRAHPTDRRATLVSFTEHGAGVATELEQGHRQLAEQLFADMPADRFACFSAGLDDVLRRLHELVAADTAARDDTTEDAHA